MTTVDERIFNLDQPNYVSYNRRKQDYLKIAPTTGTADNLNRTGIISYEVNNQANYLYLPESFLYCEFNLSNQAGTEVPGNITLEHNWFPRIFSEMRVVGKWGFQDKLHSMTPPKTLIWEMHSMTPLQGNECIH